MVASNAPAASQRVRRITDGRRHDLTGAYTPTSPTSLKSDPAAKTAARASKTAPGASKTAPGTSIRAPRASPRSAPKPKINVRASPASAPEPKINATASPRSAPGPKINAPASSVSHRASFQRAPEPLSASARAPLNHRPRLKSATTPKADDRRSFSVDDDTGANHIASLESDRRAHPRDSPPLHAESRTSDFDARSLHAAKPVTRSHRV